MNNIQENIKRIKSLMLVENDDQLFPEKEDSNENDNTFKGYIEIKSEDDEPKNLEIEFIQNNIRLKKMLNTVLFELYKDNLDWNEDNSKYGIVDVYTLNDLTSWSILNYFGGHKFVKAKLMDNFKKSNKGNTPKEFYRWVIENKEKLFKDGPILKELIRTNMNTYNKGSITEKYVIEKLKDKGFKIKYFPPGSKQDRDFGIDLEINGQSYQIKELIGMEEKDNKILIKTPLPKNYLGKEVQKIMLVDISNGDFVSFPNNNYELDIKNNCYIVDSKIKDKIKTGNFNSI